MRIRRSPRRSRKPPGPPTAGSSTADPAEEPVGAAASERPRFFYDLAWPEAYLAAERVNSALAEVPVWEPVLLAPPAPADAAVRADFERRARLAGLQPVRWPEPWPADVRVAMLAATFAAAAGRAVAFALAAFRQAFAGGRDLSSVDNVLIAAAACELHPRAVLKGIESRAVRERLERTTGNARRLGLTDAPAVAVAGRLYTGADAVDLAAKALVVRRLGPNGMG